MVSRTSKASKTSASTSVHAGVDADGQVGTQLGKALVRGILGSMHR